jgi:general secretion pathway protein J
MERRKGRMIPVQTLRAWNAQCCLRQSRKIFFGTCRGFTLIELLVALVLMALMFLLLASGLRSGARIWGDKEQEASEASHVFVVENLLRRLLSEARPVMVRATKRTPLHVDFAGSRDSIRFIAPMLQHLGSGGFYEITVAIRQGASAQRRIEISWRPFPNTSEEQHAVLFEGDVDVDFAFFGSRGAGESAQWHDDWRHQLQLPDLVLTRLTLGGRRWPDLVVSPKVQSIHLIAPEFEY